MKLNFALLAVAAVLLPAEAARDAETANFGVCGKDKNGEFKYSASLTQKVCQTNNRVASRSLRPTCSFTESCNEWSKICRGGDKRSRGICFGREFGHPPGSDESDNSYYSYYRKHGEFPDRMHKGLPDEMPNEKPKNQPDEMPKEKPDNQLDEKAGHQRRDDPDNPFEFPESDGEEDEDIDRDPVSVLDFESDGEESDDDTGDDSRDD
ncbi:hypothetical protein LZ32DRAFT_620656 [Colletotrichum eremochloae]|nr:hypothetical protein LZ32DRAFT_620656 [Colletotrichum eremochloae]